MPLLLSLLTLFARKTLTSFNDDSTLSLLILGLAGSLFTSLVTSECPFVVGEPGAVAGRAVPFVMALGVWPFNRLIRDMGRRCAAGTEGAVSEDSVLSVYEISCTFPRWS